MRVILFPKNLASLEIMSLLKSPNQNFIRMSLWCRWKNRKSSLTIRKATGNEFVYNSGAVKVISLQLYLGALLIANWDPPPLSALFRSAKSPAIHFLASTTNAMYFILPRKHLEGESLPVADTIRRQGAALVLVLRCMQRFGLLVLLFALQLPAAAPFADANQKRQNHHFRHDAEKRPQSSVSIWKKAECAHESQTL